MSKLLTLGILQQVQNSQGGGETGVLYDGEMVVGYRFVSSMAGDDHQYGYIPNASVGTISPNDIYVEYCYCRSIDNVFGGQYNGVNYALGYWRFDGIVYTSAQTLFNYLKDAYDASETVEIKLYEDAQ